MNHHNKSIPEGFDLYGHCMKRPLNKIISTHYLLKNVPSMRTPYKVFILIRPRIIPILGAITFIVMQIFNFLATYSLLGNSQTETVRKFPTTFTPAGYAFSIWSLIFTLQFLLLAVQFIVGTILGKDNKILFSKTGLWFALLHVWPTFWNIFWAIELFWVAFVFMFAYLANAAVIYFLLNVRYDTEGQIQLVEMTGNTDEMLRKRESKVRDPINRENNVEDYDEYGSNLASSTGDENNEIQESSISHLPTTHFSIEEQRKKSAYGEIKRRISIWEFLISFPVSSLIFGWLTVASLANIYIGFTASGVVYKDGYVVGGIVFAGFCATVMLLLRSDFIYSSVITWASFAIASKQKKNSEIVYSAALSNAYLLLALSIVTFIKVLLPYILRKIVYFNNLSQKFSNKK